jgi:SNF2 family DNA or RNA helicase
MLTPHYRQNGIDELFPLIHFIGVKPYNDWDRYNNDIVKPIKAGRSGTPMKRLHVRFYILHSCVWHTYSLRLYLQVVLKGIMLRRLKTDMVNGRPIIELPARDVKVVHCDFDEDERAFYDALAAKIEIAVSKFQRAGTVTSNYTAILTLLLRLRQGECLWLPIAGFYTIII